MNSGETYMAGRRAAWALVSVTQLSWVLMAVLGILIPFTVGLSAVLLPIPLVLQILCAAVSGWLLKKKKVRRDSATLVKVAFGTSACVCAILCVTLAISAVSIGLGGLLVLVLKFTVPV